MAITAAQIQTDFKAARTVLSGAQVTITHNGNAYTFLRSAFSAEEQVSFRGAQQAPTAAARGSVDELVGDHPKAGDTITVAEGSTSATRLITGVEYDSMRATIRIMYGSRYV